MTTEVRERKISLEKMLQPEGRTLREKVEAFALVNLGLVQSLSSGVLTADEATRRFYNAENCLYVRRRMKDPTCEEIMSRGVQLDDALSILPGSAAHQEFAGELEIIRSLSLKLLTRKTARRKAVGARSTASASGRSSL